MLAGLSDSDGARAHAEELLAERSRRSARSRLIASSRCRSGCVCPPRWHELHDELPTRGATTRELPGVVGMARLDRRTKNLTKRLAPGDIAVIDHVDLDRVSAEALVAPGSPR